MKRTQLYSLSDGTPFILPSSPEFKYLYLLRGGDCTCRVQGYKLNEAGNFLPFTDFFSPSTEVFHDASRKPMVKDAKGNLVRHEDSVNAEIIQNTLDKAAKNVDTQEVKQPKPKKGKIKMDTVTEKTVAVKAGRGRKRKHFVELPKDVEFTIAEVATKLGVEKFVIANEISKIKKSAPDTIEAVRTISGKKGKAAVVYKLR